MTVLNIGLLLLLWCVWHLKRKKKRHFRFVMCVVQQYWFWRAFQHHFQLIGFILTILFFLGGGLGLKQMADMWHNTRWQAHSRIAHRNSLEKWRGAVGFAWRCCWEYGHQFELFQQQPLFVELNMWLMKLHRNLHNVSPFLGKWLIWTLWVIRAVFTTK